MKKLVVEYKGSIFKVHSSKENTTIIDSYKIKKYKDMKEFLHRVRIAVPRDYSIKRRSISSLIREWRTHNLLYSLGFFKKRTGSVDLNLRQPFHIKALYFIISPFYFNFI